MDDLRKLQLIELEILKEFIRICKEYNLKYYAVGGTALGAVRHKGFIPWDDDIDIAMPREDYDKFYRIATESIDSYYEIRTINNYEAQISPMMKICDKRVKLTTNTYAITKHGHAWIDVFPIDGLPESKIARFLHTRISLFKRMFFQISVFKENANQIRKRPMHEKAIMWFCNHFDIQRFFNTRNRFLAVERVAKKYSFYKTKYCYIVWGVYKLKEIYPREWLGDGATYQFEDIDVVAPADYDKYLTQMYGDYMTPPTLEDGLNHHKIKIIHIEE